jgi:hypothetical protein
MKADICSLIISPLLAEVVLLFSEAVLVLLVPAA